MNSRIKTIKANVKQQLLALKPLDFEKLCCRLLEHLLNLRFFMAKSGMQHGADFGTSGEQGRKIRVECKRYADTTRLSDRELLGEIDDALEQDPDLELWVLAATKEVSEQLKTKLEKKGENFGLSILIIDWRNDQISSLAALCSISSKILADFKIAISSAEFKLFASFYTQESKKLGNEFDRLNIGYDILRGQSHQIIEQVWNDGATSSRWLNQNVAGGALNKIVERQDHFASFNSWLTDQTNKNSPLVIHGLEGRGKTWICANWLIESLAQHPIVLLIPSSATAKLEPTQSAIIELIASRLYEMGLIKDVKYWFKRVERLLDSSSKAARFTLVFDGLNEASKNDWLNIINQLQVGSFAGKVNLILTTRTLHFTQELRHLAGSMLPAKSVTIDKYSLVELEQALSFEGLKASELNEDLIELAREPRLFSLVVDLRHKLKDIGRVNVPRLLWEYGKDSFNHARDRGFTESDWREWLEQIAVSVRDKGNAKFKVREARALAKDWSYDSEEVFKYLSAIVDSQFVSPDGLDYSYDEHFVAFALGMALEEELNQKSNKVESIKNDLVRFFDPIAGLDNKADVLRVSLNISLFRQEQSQYIKSSVTIELLIELLHSQNIKESHYRDLKSYATCLIHPLFSALEQSQSSTDDFATFAVINILREIPKEDCDAFAQLIARIELWFGKLSRELRQARVGQTAQDKEAQVSTNKDRLERLQNLLGFADTRLFTVSGIQVVLTDDKIKPLLLLTASILDGFPLATASSLFEKIAVYLAIKPDGDIWNRVKWLILSNEEDSEATTKTLRQLSQKHTQHKAEQNIDPRLPAQIAANLLLLSTSTQDQEKAKLISPGIHLHGQTYEKDYFDDPIESHFVLEHRHIDMLVQSQVNLGRKIAKLNYFIHDPAILVCNEFILEVKALEKQIDPTLLCSSGGRSRLDWQLETWQTIMARWSPGELYQLMLQKLYSFEQRNKAARYFAALSTEELYLIANDRASDALQKMRNSGIEPDRDNESYAANCLLLLEIKHLDALSQCRRILNADITWLQDCFRHVLKPLSAAQAINLVTEFDRADDNKTTILLSILGTVLIEPANYLWQWLLTHTGDLKESKAGLAFKVLYNTFPEKTGSYLIDQSWSWQPTADLWVNHYGSRALIVSTLDKPFSTAISQIAPWLLLEAVALRGDSFEELTATAQILEEILVASKVPAVTPVAQVTVFTNQKTYPISYSIDPLPTPDDHNPFEFLKNRSDEIGRQDAALNAENVQTAALQEARASFYKLIVGVEDTDRLVRHLPKFVEKLLSDIVVNPVEMCRQVHLAEGFYLALCESLLNTGATLAVELWHFLYDNPCCQYIGVAGINELTLIPFRVRNNEVSEQLRNEVLDLANTDKILFEIAIASIYYQKNNWLEQVIAIDEAAAHIWKHRRAMVLRGFTIDATQPISGQWPVGFAKSDEERLSNKSNRLRWNDAFARYWFEQYLKAKTPQDGYASWILFLTIADRRAYCWMDKEIEANRVNTDEFNTKLIHLRLNKSALHKSMQKSEKKFAQQFLFKEVFSSFWKWQ